MLIDFFGSAKVAPEERGLILPSEFAELLFADPGDVTQPMSLSEYPHLRQPMNDGRRRVVLNFGRQTGKSTTMAVKMIYTVSMLPGFGALHVSPTLQNMTQFEDERLKPFLESPEWRRHFYTRSSTDNKSLKRLSNNSRINMRAVHKNAGRVRGITAGYVEVDELQDILTDHIFVIQMVMTKPKHKQLVMAGTQSHLDSATNFYWENSDQMEFCPLCSHCGRYNELDENNIGKTGLICRHCKLDIVVGRDVFEWIPQNPDAEHAGYRFPQIALKNADWSQVLTDLREMPQRRFYNEVLALPWDSAGRPLSRAEMRAACNGPEHFYLGREMGGYRTWAGVDWGGGEHSATVLCIIRDRPNLKMECVYFKRFSGYESDHRIAREEIARKCDEFNVDVLCADQGSDYGQNKELRAVMGTPRFNIVRLIEGMSDKMRWVEDALEWRASRTDVLSDTFIAIKRMDVTFPQWGVMEPFAREILNEYQEYSEGSRKLMYNHAPDKPDDSLQALNFAILARGIALGKYRPGGRIPSELMDF